MFTDNTAFGRLIRVWTDFSQPVGRRRYLAHGLCLAALKYIGDAFLIYVTTGNLWTPLHYVLGLPSPFPFTRALLLGGPWWLVPALLLWMLPFIAIGLTLTMRRAVDANRSPWISIVFLAPYLSYVLIAILSVVPSEAPDHKNQKPATPSELPDVMAKWRAGTAGIVTALLLAGAGVVTLGFYGVWLLVLSPFAIGAITAFVYNRQDEASVSETTALVVVTVIVAGAAMLLVAIEGAVCLVMSVPIAGPLAMLGGLVGRSAAISEGRETSSAMFMLLALPLTGAIEPASGRVVHEVQSSVVINARPEDVWPHVVSFSDIPEPRDWLFQAGIAYPIRARIEGRGVGAVRYCEFSTGAFVEPITVWAPGRSLSFNVAESPAPLRELSPYENLSPPHLHGYLRSKRGEFRFVDLGDGRTRLEGSTWYELEMAPEIYWQMFSDALIHRIHLRVLDHIKQEVESSSAASMRG